MNLKKRFSTFFAALLCLSLVAVTGCSSSEPEPQGGMIKIGGNFELTGGMSEYGKKAENGVLLAVKEANASGGVLGKQIEYVGSDNKSETTQAAAAVTILAVQDQVAGIIGPVTNGNILGLLEAVADNQIPLITPTGTNESITLKSNGTVNKWLFRACFINSYQGTVAANFALDTLKASKAAVITDQKANYAAYSNGLAKNFIETFTKAGKEIVDSEQYNTEETKDYSNILNRIKEKNPDVIFLPGYYSEAGAIIKQARDLGLKMPIIGGDGWTGSLIDIAGKDALNNTYYVDHFAGDDPAAADFVKAYKDEYKQDADNFSALGYDAAKMLIAAINKANSTDSDQVRAALETMTSFQGVTGEMTVDPATHNTQKSAAILKYVNGKKMFAQRVTPQ
ncbi:Extracellular ligand-binding receptor [Syntrophobotulus glycolicus DSM 8271]|uniref:Extracellular ligand-binding receptor n=1 Tax=Syntrophobotulus glycolicus (strain DSM 8271 / FlGlyR) TaxID=645991 RepID=F0T2Y1_SYNGF|nr:ABC transporter substrate-binding protein [Syntrophobotulus glycolicus]ADY57618.1 Extracellular ligand-binding receptor [Syntrophobotulus glycolicus DSM 8271]